MTKKLWLEVTCDRCGNAEHFVPPMTNKDLEKEGYTMKGVSHYCCLPCLHYHTKAHYDHVACKRCNSVLLKINQTRYWFPTLSDARFFEKEGRMRNGVDRALTESEIKSFQIPDVDRSHT